MCVGRWCWGERSVGRTLWRNLGRTGQWPAWRSFLGSPIVLQKCSFIMESKHLSLSLFFSGQNAHHREAWSWASEPTVGQEARSKEQHYNVRSPHPWRSCGGDRGVTWSKGIASGFKHVFHAANSGPWTECPRGQPMTHSAKFVLSNLRSLGLLGGNVLNSERDFVFQMSITSFQVTSPPGSKIYVEVISWKTCFPCPQRFQETTSAIWERSDFSQTYF